MTDRENGPPKEDRAPRGPIRSRGSATTPTTNHPTAYLVQLKRRREASRRLPVLDSGRSDPWHYDDGPALRGYEAAARHLLGHGLMPAPNCVALQSMWRCGGVSRRVAEVIAAAWELNA